MTTPACPVCGTHSDLGCERTDGDEGECPFARPAEPDPDDMRDLQADMHRVWGDEQYDD